ncbi:hypothetical protein B9Y88_03615 [Stenotrophomonas maltophilia]|uniref:type III toxin-antitoxin system ToxN/AbiQ family toxin n=1 Tax=Stenotrophomonas TaxID=40323 RepID=UPI000C25CF3B|nr:MULTISPECIES: type III toxin-antitoxin system ToxN/AbiQ family toxin [unclassified Stenotrophomonas]MCU1057701.1 type III toxin-antitoxin system ToxN/AbiQ family toxin [Stenotrophomonas maltophilia]MDH1244667.1 type III toxin-antitoxin system ToxN/AbiQ family toxin [Stenotrophomonas sp. GD03948]MDH1577224.1 type III toxin-antitoxin system ToxN/AbiQ family toxin [Stenotrophomonas sp. GD03744]PJL79336.1 hypothetical protein B9Y88_03615 [Stenotrophomonas maltophilia]
MHFYTVKEEYLDLLRAVDSKVPNSSGDNYKGKKPFIGVVLQIGGHNFFAPLTSYKASQEKIKSSSCTAFKLHERGNPDNKLGLISLNYMLPVPENALERFDLEGQEEKYKRMMYLQYEFIKANDVEILERALKLYESVVVKRVPFLVNISCKFSALIDKSREYSVR